jgi:hypothetical protein
LQQFSLFAYADPHEASRGQFAFRLEGFEEERVGVSEPATSEGIIAQQMRHNEAFARMMTQGFGTVMTQMSRINTNLSDTLDKMMGKRGAEIEAHEAALSLKSERELALASAKSADERLSKGMDRIWSLAPALINRIAKEKIVPEDLSVGEHMLIQLAKGITPDQLKSLSTILTPEQAFLMQELIEKAMDANERAAKKG